MDTGGYSASNSGLQIWGLKNTLYWKKSLRLGGVCFNVRVHTFKRRYFHFIMLGVPSKKPKPSLAIRIGITLSSVQLKYDIEKLRDWPNNIQYTVSQEKFKQLVWHLAMAKAREGWNFKRYSENFKDSHYFTCFTMKRGIMSKDYVI